MDNSLGFPHQSCDYRPQNAAEERYNAAHQKTRHTVERCIGVLKSRFRCLCRQRVLMYSPQKAGAIIVSCVVLHNIMINEKYKLPPEAEINDNMDDDSDDENDDIDPLIAHADGNAARANMIRQHFQ